MGEVLQNELRKAGIGVSIRNVDHLTKHDEIPAFNYDLSLFVTYGAPYDPHGSLTALFLSTYQSGTDGKIWMDAAQLDPLIVTALGADEASRDAAYQAVFAWIHDNHAAVPIYHATRIWAHGPRVSAFSISPTEYEFPLEGIALGG